MLYFSLREQIRKTFVLGGHHEIPVKMSALHAVYVQPRQQSRTPHLANGSTI